MELIILLKIGKFIKLIQVVLISGLKFIVAPPVSIEMGFRYFETVIFTTAGGILGVFFFYHLSGWLIRTWKKSIIILRDMIRNSKPAKSRVSALNKRTKYASLKKRTIARIHRKYGLFGIVALTPVLLSIPLGSFLARKYYSRNRNILVYLSVSVMVWSFIVSTIYFYSS